jgi:D-alanyl-D-alanine carboxypeptidase/D-alanyl-D-alanine-endopeptidase (penicillin-binding protein 4)
VGFGADRALRPASNMKLVTTAAALVLLGPDWRFETAFESAAPIRDGVLAGDLVVRAGGDPLFVDGADGEVEPLLAPVAAALVARGVRSIAGDLVLDEGSFEPPGPGPEWPDEGQHWTEYCALAGGFSANRGALAVQVVPGRPGQAAAVKVRPAAHGLEENLGVRTTSGGRLTIALHARSSGVLVKGTIPAGGSGWHEAMAHPDPVELFGSVLARSLAHGGVLLQGRVRRERDVRLGAGARELHVLRSPWMPLLRPINTDSTNALADQLFLATGLAVRGEGTRSAAAAATGMALDRLGVSAHGLVQVDGSGLSRANRVTAAQMTALIEAVLSGPPGSAEAYVQSLALAGETGTLDDRMRSGPARGRVRAKTGFIAGTSALSGVVHAESGRSFVFSVLVNYPNLSGLNTSCWKPMQDEICERLVKAAP